MTHEFAQRRLLRTTGSVAAALSVANVDGALTHAAEDRSSAHGLRKALKDSMLAGKWDRDGEIHAVEGGRVRRETG